MSKRSAPLILSLALLLFSLAVWKQVDQHFAPDQQPAPPPVAVAVAATPAPLPQERLADETIQVIDSREHQIEGVWEQYSIEGDKRQFMARLQMTRQGDGYLATPVEFSPDTYPQKPYRSYDHAYANGVWTFKEDWGPTSVGEFVLEKQPNGQFEGTARYAGREFGIDTVFVKVAD